MCFWLSALLLGQTCFIWISLLFVKYSSLFLFLFPDRSKAEMDLKELSESVQQQTTPVQLISPKRQIRSRFQLNLDKTIESCKAQLGKCISRIQWTAEGYTWGNVEVQKNFSSSKTLNIACIIIRVEDICFLSGK